MTRPFTLTRPAPIQLRASVLEPRPALDSARSSVFNVFCKAILLQYYEDSMSGSLVECVPNFSEGKDARKVDAIAASIASVGGIAVLDVTLDPDHNRSVITFAGPPEAAAEAAIRAVARAVEAIDLNTQAGVHPRIGAADVVPFVPVCGISLQACAGLATIAGEQIWRRLGVPVYLYEAAARRADRVNLENIRRGGFEKLRDEVRVNTERRPDFGEAALHP